MGNANTYLFSALKVGPKVYTEVMAHAYVSTLSCPDTVKNVGSPKKSSLYSIFPCSSRRIPPILRLAISISVSSFFNFNIASTAGFTKVLSPPSSLDASFTTVTCSPAAVTASRFT